MREKEYLISQLPFVSKAFVKFDQLVLKAHTEEFASDI